MCNFWDAKLGYLKKKFPTKCWLCYWRMWKMFDFRCTIFLFLEHYDSHTTYKAKKTLLAGFRNVCNYTSPVRFTIRLRSNCEQNRDAREALRKTPFAVVFGWWAPTAILCDCGLIWKKKKFLEGEERKILIFFSWIFRARYLFGHGYVMSIFCTMRDWL